MTRALDDEHQTPALPGPSGPAEMNDEHYITGHARLGRYAGERHRAPATRAGQRGTYSVAAWFRKQGYQVIRSPSETAPPDLLAWSSEELVMVLIRRTRRRPPSLHAIADLYSEEIRTLRGLPVPKGYHSSYQFWLSVSSRGWRIFDVMKGGIREITRDIWSSARPAGRPSPLGLQRDRAKLRDHVRMVMTIPDSEGLQPQRIRNHRETINAVQSAGERIERRISPEPKISFVSVLYQGGD